MEEEAIPEEEDSSFLKLREFCKQVWNARESPDRFLEQLKLKFSKKYLEMFIFHLIEEIEKHQNELNISLNDYLMTFISNDPSLFFTHIDLTNPSQISIARRIIEMSKIDFFNALPVNCEKSAVSALNVLLIVLMNENKTEMKKDVSQLARSSYFSILISSGLLFCTEKYKQAQILFKENDPFECPIYRLPVTQLHLALSLFPDYLLIPFHYNDKFRVSFYIFTIFQLIILDSSNIKIFITDETLVSFYCSFLNSYLKKPTYTTAFLLDAFPKKHFKSKSIIKVKDFFAGKREDDSLTSSYFENYYHSLRLHKIDQSGSILENILHFFYDSNQDHHREIDFFNSNIIHDQLPNGILSTYEDALNFLTSKPDTFSINTLIEDALKYPSFIPEIADIFMSKLKEKDFESVEILSIQILKRIDDIRLAWIIQGVFLPIMTSIYEILIEIDDHHFFEVLFFLFISFYEGLTRQGDEDINNALSKFISTMNEPFRLFLSNFLNHKNEILICKFELEEDKPIKKLIDFLDECKINNDFDMDEIIKYPYLVFSAFIWGVKTLHPNSLKLLSIQLPKYKILKRFFVYLSASHKSKTEPSFVDSSNFIYSLRTSDISFDLLTRFLPSNESGIRIILLRHLQQITSPNIKITQYQGIIISWRAWIKIFSIEQFVIILLETLIWDGSKLFVQDKIRNNFLIAERLLANVFLNSIKSNICFSVENPLEFNLETNKFEGFENMKKFNTKSFDISNIRIDKALKTALWTALEFVNNYEGSYTDGTGLASFCLLLSISIINDWKSEFKKVLDFSNKMLKESNWKSLKYSFGKNFLDISTSIIETHDLIDIETFDTDFLRMNWKFGISFYFIHSEIKRLKELKIISFD